MNPTAGMLSSDGRPQCSVFLSPESATGYTEFLAAPTTGRVTLFVNGRSGKDQLSATDRVETFTSMEGAVGSTKKGDFVYLAAWQFNPGEVALTAGPAGRTWADLLLDKARAGVTIPPSHGPQLIATVRQRGRARLSRWAVLLSTSLAAA